MVEEVVPLPENLIASFMLTTQESYDSPGFFGSSVLVYIEETGFRSMSI
jgi:hypothetical protein